MQNQNSLTRGPCASNNWNSILCHFECFSILLFLRIRVKPWWEPFDYYSLILRYEKFGWYQYYNNYYIKIILLWIVTFIKCTVTHFWNNEKYVQLIISLSNFFLQNIASELECLKKRVFSAIANSEYFTLLQNFSF